MAKVAGFLAASLALSLAGAACGDRAGDPVVAAEPISQPSQQDTDASSPSDQEPRGLCAACERGEECGAGDLCLRPAGAEIGFCGRACSDNHDCPNGYRCTEVGRNDIRQCVPDTGDCTHVVSDLAPTLAAIRSEAVAQLNQLRSEYSLPPLEGDPCLHAIAQDSAAELRRSGDFLGKFESECEPLDPSQCECGWNAQSERNVVEFALTWEEALEESILDRALRDPDDSFVRHLTSPAHVRVGFGILLSGDEAWTAISFGREP